LRENHANWDEWISYAFYVYNTTIHTTTAYTPLELVYGFISEVPSALRETPNVQLLSNQEKCKEYYDKDSETIEIQIGQKVLLFDETVRRGRIKKLSPQYFGP